MKARIVLAGMLVAVFLLPGGTAFAAGGTSKVTGGIHFAAPNFGMEGWMRFDVHATGPGDLATGWLRWQEYTEKDGWRHVVAHPICVTLSENEAAAVIVVQIDSRSGWGEGEQGQYILFWARDGGTPGSNGDQFTTLTWPPQYEPLACTYTEPSFIFATIDGGDLMIHR